MPLPEGFVEKGLELAKGATLYGEFLEEMTREELLAAAAHGWRAAREVESRRLDTL